MRANFALPILSFYRYLLFFNPCELIWDIDYQIIWIVFVPEVNTNKIEALLTSQGEIIPGIWCIFPFIIVNWRACI